MSNFYNITFLHIVDMKCAFYVNTTGLLSLKWIKNEPNMSHQMNRIHIMKCDSCKLQLQWQVRYLSDMVLIFWSIAIRCACLSALSCVLVRLITHLEEKNSSRTDNYQRLKRIIGDFQREMSVVGAEESQID